jgi:hypothetical protein
MKQFLIKSTLLTLILFIIGAVAYTTILKSYYLSVLPAVVVFYYLVTNIVHAYLLKIAEKSGARFTSQYTAISFLKMFIYLVLAIIYIFLDRGNAKPFIVAFLILYVVYTVFEVLEFLKVVKQKN